MNLLFLASEINELEEEIERIGKMYEEIYIYTKRTYLILLFTIITVITIILIKLLVKWQSHLNKKEWPKEDKKILKNEIDNNQ